MEHSDMRRMMQEALELKTGEVFEIIYHGGSSPGSRRTIMPLKVDKYTVYAKCFASDSEKTFRFDNMELAKNSNAPLWQQFDQQKTNTSPKKKARIFDSINDPMSKKSIFFMALFFGLIAGYFFGYIGFIIVFCLFVYVGLDNNRKLKKKSVASQTQAQTTVFAPTSTSGKTISIDSQSTGSTDTNNLSSKTNFTSVPTPTTKTEARQMVKELETEEDVRNFVLSCEEAQDNLYDNHDLTEKQLDKLSDLLSDAMDLAEFKTLAWQFLPDVSPQTSLEELNIAYKMFSNSEYKSLPKKFKQDKSWLELTIGDEPDLPDEFLANLIDFREIVESKISDDQMITAIDNYLSEHPIFMEEYFGELNEDASLTHGQEWFASKLSQLGLPAAWELYAEGYTTIEKCLEIDPNEFIKRRGIGPKKKQQLIEFQEKHR
ncbi:hypothetical protein [Marinomonas posidonica]|uniref:Uncharacterized protein n=1 Tax=Marinomonas posidonica (strain CECT 7376 / NCIMB 14433 / IVIA-Po-181) TaxID=491952 RepID=F6CTJ4_MARPP|nr:hypothetical protein [Marinomonas posidonica]AEF54043.1 hypothetical protein Mar181_0994 [Marinomonas posidonica IVIA-Po-181]